MALHDAYARLTPFERFLPDDDFAREHFDAIEAEADEREVDPRDAEAFVMLMAAGTALRELRGPAEDPERIRQHGALLYQAYHFDEARRAGRDAEEPAAPLFLVTLHAARWLVEWEPDSGAADADPLLPPVPAGYVQLPQHLFWTPGAGDGEARDGADATPESIDGFFWTVAPGEARGGAADGGWLNVLLCAGLRPDRPGFSVVPLPPAPLSDARTWLTLDGRGAGIGAGEGADFASELPGADLEGLYEIRTPGEVLKLAARLFHHLETVPGAREVRTGEAAEPEPSGPEASGLDYVSVGLG